MPTIQADTSDGLASPFAALHSAVPCAASELAAGAVTCGLAG
jgi:hypothetical protein